jgi:hypothetical protein
MSILFVQELEPLSNINYSLIFFGEPSLENLAPIYKEFQRWKALLQKEFQAYLIKKYATE